MWRINNDELLSQSLPEDGGLHHRLPEKLGLGHSNIFRLEDDLSYIETQYSPCQDLAILSRMDYQEPRMVVTLGLQGSSRFTTHRGDDVAFREGYTSITTFNSSQGARQYLGNKAVTQLRFSMTRSWLDRYFGEPKLGGFFDNAAIRVVSHQPISPHGLVAAHALLNCRVAEKVRPLFRQGQAMAILASELSHLLVGRLESAKPKPRDTAIAHQARDILYAEFKNPPSVEELAKRVGTNQFKLKQLFHHFFDNTPYGLLLEIRMNKAYQLLKSTNCSVGSAAETVGYNHASNFSTAFVKYFGFPPKQI
ncbi:MAG: AraC family transcriptional regulator [Methylococcaceae bacterium]|nr:AraC family transcriptional regulator [Methylococcaceae bacterium]